MMFKRLSDSFRSATHQARRRQSRPPLLSLEPLEDRRLLATFSVTSNVDGVVAAAGDLSGSLRQAIFDANVNPGDDTITFDAAVFTGGNASLILLTAGELRITHTLTVDGSTGSGLTIDAQGSSRVLNFSAASGDLTLDDLTITGGKTTGDNIESSDSTYSGGGIRFLSSGTLNVISSTISENRTVGDFARGGGIFLSEGIVNLTSSTLSDNRTTGDESPGGGIFSSEGTVNLISSTVNGNRTAGDESLGGGVATSASGVNLFNSTLSDNSTAGVRAEGGGIYTDSGVVSLTSSTLSGNNTTGRSADGGGINTGSGAVILAASTLSGNSTTGLGADGGGVYARGNVNLTNSTLSGNTAAGGNADGGGLWFSSSSTVVISNSTVTENVATGVGGGLSVAGFGVGELLTIRNSIIAGNSDSGVAPDFDAPNNPRTNLVVSHSLIGDNTGTALDAAAVGSPDADGNLVGTPSAPIDPLLSPLALNGGPTQTHPLSAASPALNAGDPAFTSSPTFDQRGAPFVRVADSRMDMGANESQTLAAPFFVVTTATDELDYFNADVSLREAINSANGSLGADVITFAPTVFTGDTASLIRLTAGELQITNSLTIDGSMGTDVTITGDGSDNDVTNEANITDVAASRETLLADNSRVFHFSASTGDLTFEGLTLTGGQALNSSGGGIRFLSNGTLQLIDSTVSGNSAAGEFAHGAGVYVSRGAVTLTRSTVSGNESVGQSARGAGIFTNFGAVRLTNSTVSGNIVTGTGANGGGIHTSFGDVDLVSSSVSGNSTSGIGADGGGIHTTSGDVTLSNSTVSGNSTEGSASNGGGINTSSGDVTLFSSTVSGNSVAGTLSNGGGIKTSSGEVNLFSSTVSGNSTGVNGGGGGGIHTSSGDVALSNSIISGNSTEGTFAHGGGIQTGSGDVMLTNSTVSGNRTEGIGADGGGIHTSFGDVTLSSSTVSENGALGTSGRGGGIAASSSVTINNSIVGGNLDSGVAPDIFDIPSNPQTNLIVSHSLIGDHSGTTLTAAAVGFPDSNGNLIGTTVSPIDPLLSPLALNGGLTQTHALLPGSPALNAGDPAFTSSTTFDQRSSPFVRVADSRIDMGAYENQTLAAPFFVVTTTTDELDYSNADVSLREAINSANGSLGADVITFAPAVFTGGSASLISLTAGELEITKALTIADTDQASVVIAAQGDSRVLNFSASAGDLTLDGLTLTGGRTTGDNIGPNNTYSGGGIRFLSNATLSLISSTVSGNSTIGERASGGGIFTSQGVVNLTDSRVNGNTTAGGYADGGGIKTLTGSVTLINSTVSGNSTKGLSADGGGIFSGDGAVTLTNSTVSGNSTAGRIAAGGGIRAHSGSVTLNSSTVSGNSTVGDNANGGGISTYSSSVALNNSSVSGNSTAGYGASGGGIRTFRGSVTLNSSSVSGNATAGDGAKGGGISSHITPYAGLGPAGAVTLSSSTVSGNSTAGENADGGGIFTHSSAVTLTSSTASGNNTAGDSASGGGINTTSGFVTLTNSTISGNSAGGDGVDGGGIHTFGGSVTLISSTVSGNEATRSGGGVSFLNFSSFTPTPALTLQNSIVAGNTADSTTPDLKISPFRTLTINDSLIGVTDGLTMNGSNNQTGTVANPLDPLLGPLTFNGGPTQTHALLLGSPAIDAGNATEAFDQRGVARVVDVAGVPNAAGSNGADIGAYEQDPALPFGTPPVIAFVVRDEGGTIAQPDLLSTFAVSFDVDVSVSADDLVIHNDTVGGTVVDSAGLVFGYDAMTHTATWDFTSLTLEPAFYSFVLSDSIVSIAGNLSLDGDVDENPGGVFVESIYVALPGDANLDGTVDVLGDAALLVNNLGTTADAGWVNGDFNGDGAVDVLGDAAILVNRLGQSVVPMAGASSAFTTTSALAYGAQTVGFTTDQTEQPQLTRLPSPATQLSLAGSQNLDAAFASGNLIDDGLF